GIAAELIHVASFTTVIEFFPGPGNELAYRFDHPVNKSKAQTLDEVDRSHHQSDISREVGVHAWSLHLYCYLAPAEVAHMHLAELDEGPPQVFKTHAQSLGTRAAHELCAKGEPGPAS